MRRASLALIAAALLAGCGGSDSGSPKAPPGVPQKTFDQQLAQAADVSRADFPATDGRTLEEIAGIAAPGNSVGFATSVLVPGTDRLAFGILDKKNSFVYGKTAVYVARTPSSPAQGPYPAPADSLVTKPAYRSQTAASESSPIASIYEAQIPFERAGAYAVLIVSKRGGRLVGAATTVRVARSSPIPDAGERPPAVDTETVSGSGGNIKSIDTRVPPAPELHRVSFKDVVGRKPVALLFATPQLCQSRVCGPVVDIALQMRAEFGDRMAFIHQEVWQDNRINTRLREPLRAFHLQTEPWLFTVDRRGRVVRRLEGSFGQRAFRDAIQAALRS